MNTTETSWNDNRSTQVKESYNESDRILVSEFGGTYRWVLTDLYYQLVVLTNKYLRPIKTHR
jgi:hypothetical protein